MKKLSVLLLVIAIVFTAFNINIGAVTGELLTNGDFETGHFSNYVKMVDATKGEIGSSYAQKGSYGLKISNRTQAHATYCQDVTQIIKNNGNGVYQFSVWMRLTDNDQPSASGFIVLRLTNTNNEQEYITSSKKKLTTSWQQFTINTVVALDDKTPLRQAYLYPQTPSDNNKYPDICVDNYSLKKTTDITNVPKPDISSIKRSETTTVGAIRWDAWYTHDGKQGSIISQVERSLSPARFHFRAPFFAEITGKDSIIIPEYTQEIFDREMAYAKYAGIDYFAYVWYEGAMKAARVFHTKSKYKNDVKMCVCFDGNAINKDYARKEMRTLLKEDYYMTVLDGRPLMYYFASGTNTYEIHQDILYYRQLAKEIGVKEPFAVVMNSSVKNAEAVSGDAISKYGVSKSGLTFNKLAASAVELWESNNKTGFQYVPNLTAGWDPEPRYINPVSWTTVNKGSWSETAKSQEIFEHLAYALSYMQHPEVKKNTMANTVIMYAWNEHDEGGWICPTLKVDEGGNQLYNSDGTKQLDESRINAVKLAIDFYKKGQAVQVKVNGVSNNSSLLNASDPYPNLNDLLNKKVYEGISWDKNTQTQPTPISTATLPETTPFITQTDDVTSSPTNTVKATENQNHLITSSPTAAPKELDNKPSFVWLYISGGIVLTIIGITTFIIIKKKKNDGK